MNSNESMKGVSRDDNEMAGRLLLMAGVGIIAAMVLAITPILVAGFLIGLIWYGAYFEDGEPNGERLIWPICITLAAFIYFLGFVPPFEKFHQGALFTDFGNWTLRHVADVLSAVNEMLPKKFAIKSFSVMQVRLYGWAAIPVAIATLIYLRFKGAGKGLVFYRSCRVALLPLRILANYWQTLVGLTCLLLVSYLSRQPSWVTLGIGLIATFLLIYYLLHCSETFTNKVEAGQSTNTLLLGHEKGKPHKQVILSEEQLNHHVHIVGASGFGKSVLLSHVIKNRIHAGRGLLFVDLKADFETIRQVVSQAEKAKRGDDLYIFSCGNPEFSNHYNVLENGTANQLKDRIMGSLSWSEEFYKNEAASFLLKLLRGLVAARDTAGTPFDLGTILKCIEEPKQIVSVLDALPVTEAEIRNDLKGLLGHVTKLENLRALQGLKSQLESLLLSDFGHLLKSGQNGIDLFSAISEQKIVYILLDSRTYGESSRALGRIVLQDLKAASAKIDNLLPRASRKPFTVIVDEFADLASEDFIGFLDRARSSKIGVVVAHQEIADLSKVSPEFARRLMNSTSTCFSFLQKLGDSSNVIAEIAGTRKTKEATEQAKSNWLFGDEKTGLKSIKEVDEFVIHPNVIRSLSVGECALIQKYPKSLASIVKIKAEVKDEMSEEQVKRILRDKKMRRAGPPATSPPGVQQAGLPVTEQEAQTSKYWKNEIENP